MVRTQCSARWLSENMGISRRHLVRVKNDLRHFPGPDTLEKYWDFRRVWGQRHVPTALEISTAACREAMLKHWAKPEYRKKMLGYLQSDDRRAIDQATARRSWSKNGGLRKVKGYRK